MAVLGKLSNSVIRVLTGFALAAVFFFCVAKGGFALAAILAIVQFFGSKEYVKVLNHKGFYPSLKIIYCAEVLFTLLAYFNRFDLVAVTLTLCAIGSLLWVLFRGRQPYIANAATTLLGMIYCGWFPLHLLPFRNLQGTEFGDGLWFVVIMFAAVIMTDTGCYYAGRHLGKHKLAPVISPNKTIEGSIGGAVCAVVVSLLFAWYIGMNLWLAALLGVICTTFAQLGDLCESLIKRDAGVKDSGDILPGHGGFMDRCDSYILTIPVMYYFCKYFVFSQDLVNSIVNSFKGLF